MNISDDKNQENLKKDEVINKAEKTVSELNSTKDVEKKKEKEVVENKKNVFKSISSPANSSDGKDIAPELIEKVISINRITKVTKGGKNLSFSALVVVGDTKGRVGYCLDKANEVATAIKKSIVGAKKHMITVPLKGTTIPHEIIGRCGGASVLLKPAVDGTGVIASGPVRAICDGVGIHNILTKCHRSNNPINVIKATIDGLSRLKSKRNN